MLTVCVQALKEKGYTSVLVQTGLGWPVEPTDYEGIELRSYDFKPSLSEDLKAADLIISHAGISTLPDCCSCG